MGGAKSVIETMIRLGGGPKSVTGSINFQEYLKQAESVEEMQDSLLNKISQNFLAAFRSHPFNSVRAREIDAWCDTEHFRKLLAISQNADSAHICPQCEAAVQDGWRFCRACGMQLSDGALGTQTKKVPEPTK
jgi:hypothetical protein